MKTDALDENTFTGGVVSEGCALSSDRQRYTAGSRRVFNNGFVLRGLIASG